MSIPWKLFTMTFCLLAHTGCMELVRRPDSDAPNTWGAWSAADSTGADRDSVFKDGARMDTSRRRPPREQAGNWTRETRPASSASQRARVRQVNQYALWCIQRSLWNEARSHLEQALGEDSLAASLYNNLAIVYEHLGSADSAEACYQRALQLDTGHAEYRRNLERLRRARSAAADTLETTDLFGPRKRIPEPQQAPYPR